MPVPDGELHRVPYVDGIWAARDLVVLICCSGEQVVSWYMARSENSRNSAVLRLKDRPPPGIAAWESLERSHPRNSSSLIAVSSYLTVVDTAQAVHLHRWDPDEVLPLRLVRAPQ